MNFPECPATLEGQTSNGLESFDYNCPGVLIPISDVCYGVPIVFKKWVCTNPDCNYQIS